MIPVTLGLTLMICPSTKASSVVSKVEKYIQPSKQSTSIKRVGIRNLFFTTFLVFLPLLDDFSVLSDTEAIASSFLLFSSILYRLT